LDYLEDRFGKGTVQRINGMLKKKYDPGMWKTISGGLEVEKLWENYCDTYCIERPPKPSPNPSPNPPSEDNHQPVAEESVSSQETPTPTPPPSTILSSLPQETPTATPSIASSSDIWPFAGNTPLAQIMMDRLKNITFDGSSSGSKYVEAFEQLIDRVQPDMCVEDRFLLLVFPLFFKINFFFWIVREESIGNIAGRGANNRDRRQAFEAMRRLLLDMITIMKD
jgi:Peptidase of plants and bacteria